jgi:hypothetical protein
MAVIERAGALAREVNNAPWCIKTSVSCRPKEIMARLMAGHVFVLTFDAGFGRLVT